MKVYDIQKEGWRICGDCFRIILLRNPRLFYMCGCGQKFGMREGSELSFKTYFELIS